MRATFTFCLQRSLLAPGAGVTPLRAQTGVPGRGTKGLQGRAGAWLLAGLGCACGCRLLLACCCVSCPSGAQPRPGWPEPGSAQGPAAAWTAMPEVRERAARLGCPCKSWPWLCFLPREKRHVAVKVAKGGEAFADAAQDEISLLRCVNSMKKKDRAGENIVHLLDDFKMIGVNGFHVCSVFELLGPSLRCLMRIHGAQGLPLPFVKKALLQVLAGLHFLHKHCRIIHADIKPENILLHASEASLQSFLFDADAWNQSPGVGPLRSGRLGEGGRDR
ncbi:SRSF protein kinase 3-like isoform X1 [Alligator sinensis]|uniref:non-specific serine/threonine protein kinase n=1 Tax=Alligator sinensis TaxID=38654 RepID=A0A3Q0FNB6_ALLSI|nr:SRSF protein kinase 3-like isoform X1 [Alligator sinensis]